MNNKWKQLSVNDIKQQLDQYVIGHHHQKEQLISLFISHFERVDLIESGVLESFNKSSALLIGPSGSGKTYLVETLCKILDVDFISYDIGLMTAPGWRGEDFKDILELLYKKCKHDRTRTEHSVIFLDEFDKKMQSYLHEKSYSAKDQAALLKPITDDTFYINSERICTKHILFIFGGAFADITMGKNDKKLGLNATASPKATKQITKHDLIEHGILRELLGRIGQVIQLYPLTYEEQRQILLSAKESSVNEWASFLKSKGIELLIDDQVIDKLVKDSYGDELGARGVYSAFNEIMLKEYYKIKSKRSKGILIADLDQQGNYRFTYDETVEEVLEEINTNYDFCYIQKSINPTNEIASLASQLTDYSLEIFKYKNKKQIYANETLLNLIVTYLIYECPLDDHNTNSIIKLLDYINDEPAKKMETIIRITKATEDHKQIIMKSLNKFKSNEIYLEYDSEALKKVIRNFAYAKNKEKGELKYEHN